MKIVENPGELTELVAHADDESNTAFRHGLRTDYMRGLQWAFRYYEVDAIECVVHEYSAREEAQ